MWNLVVPLNGEGGKGGGYLSKRQRCKRLSIADTGSKSKSKKRVVVAHARAFFKIYHQPQTSDEGKNLNTNSKLQCRLVQER